MIDPSIALSYRPQVQPENPLDIYGKAMSLQSMANNQKIQQQDIAANDLQVRQNSALNASIQAATTKNDDGNVSIDQAAVQKRMSDLGFGAAGQKWAAAQKETDLKISNLSLEHQVAVANTQKMLAGTLSSVRSTTDPAQRQALWTQKRNEAIQNFKLDPKSIPEQVPDDASLATMEDTALDAHQRIQLRISKQQADTAGQREKDYGTMAEAANNRAQAALNNSMNKGEGDWKPNGSRNGKAIYFNTKTGDERVGGPIDLEDGTNKGSKLTANGQAVQDRFETKQINDARGDLDEVHERRTVLGQALNTTNGEEFYNPLTKKREEMDDETRATIQQEYGNWTNKGKRIMREWGGKASGNRIGADEFSGSGGDKSAKPAATDTNDKPAGGGKAWVYDPKKGLQPK
jgi:hypothetical protein